MINRECQTIEALGHSKNEPCTRVSTLFDIMSLAMTCEHITRLSGHSVIVYDKSIAFNKEFIDKTVIPYAKELDSQYSRQIKLKVVN